MYWFPTAKAVSTMSGCSAVHASGNRTGANFRLSIMSGMVSSSTRYAGAVSRCGERNDGFPCGRLCRSGLCHEFAPRPMQDLIEVARRRKNVIPIMADATRPDRYAPLVELGRSGIPGCCTTGPGLNRDPELRFPETRRKHGSDAQDPECRCQKTARGSL